MTYLSLFIAFFKVGIIGFGGGIAMLPLIYQSIQYFGFMSAEEFTNLVALSQITPGAIAVNTATYVGEEFAGPLGAVVATLGVVIPSFVILILVLKYVSKYKESRIVQGVLTGIRPASIGLIAAALIFMAPGVLWQGTHINIAPIIMFLCAMGLALWNRINPIWILLGSGVIGALVLA